MPNNWEQLFPIIVQIIIKVAKDAYFQKQFGNCNGDTRKMWKVLNDVLKRKSKKN